MTSVNIFVISVKASALSCTATVNVYVPAEPNDGVPLITALPVLKSVIRVRPAGNAPLLRLQTYGGVHGDDALRDRICE